MKPTDVLNHYKTQQLAANALGLAQASIAKWLNKGVVPDLRQLQLERLTGGALKAEKNILPRKKSYRQVSKNSCDSSKDKADRLDSKPKANPFEWMGKSQAMDGVRAKSIRMIKQDAVRENPESSLGYATRETNSFKAPR